MGVGELQLPQVLIKPRKIVSSSSAVTGGGLLNLVIKSTHPPLLLYDTLVTGMGWGSPEFIGFTPAASLDLKERP